METTTVFAFVFTFALVLAPNAAFADDAPPPQAAAKPATSSAPGTASAENPDAARSSDRPTGRGLGLGLENGLFGRAYEQGVRIRIPILDGIAFNLRGISTMGDAGSDLRWALGGRAEVIGHTPVFLRLVRLYGGGGPEIATRVSGPGDERTRIGGGGQFGFEFFLNPGMSFFIEVGGHAGDDLTGGGTALAGMALYPFTGP